MIEFTFIGVNDDEAIYNYCAANMQAEKTNPFYNEKDYTLICLGVIEMEGSKKEVGIKYEYEKDFNIIFDEIQDFQKPKYNQAYYENINKEGEEAERIKKELKGGKDE